MEQQDQPTQNVSENATTSPKKAYEELPTVRLPPPYSQRLRKKNDETKFKKFLDVFKQLHINISVVEELEQMASYVKFLKDILTRKRKIRDFEIMALIKDCSHLVKINFSPKLKGSRQFHYPLLYW